MKILLRHLLVLLLSSVVVSAADPQVEPLIKKARAYLASEETIAGVKTLYYKGRISGPDGTDRGELRMFFALGGKQRVEHESDKHLEVTATNGFEGFKILIQKEAGKRRLQVLPPETVERLIINAYENTGFFRGIEKRKGKIKYAGQEQVDGKQTEVLLYEYPKGIWYRRFFDPATGNLLATISDKGQKMVEVEDHLVDDIRFPREVQAYGPDDKLLFKINFEEIEVNPDFQDSLFDFPQLKAAR